MGRLLWPILIIAAIALGLVVSASGAEKRAQIEFMSEVYDHSVQMSRNGDALRNVANRLATISRDEVEAVIGGIQEDLDAALEFVEAEPEVSSVLPVRAMFREALVSWDIGVVGFGEAVINASDNPSDPTAIDQMAAALAELRAGDNLYWQMVTDLERDDMPDSLTPLPEVVMMPGQGGLVALSITYVDAARSPDNSLTLRPGLAVSSVVAEPEWLIDANGQVALPSTETVVFSVVMTNVGNVDSVPQTVTLTLIGLEGLESLEKEVEALPPGRQTTLVFDPMEVAPGNLYEVTAAIQGVAEDVDLEDNTRSVQFTVTDD